MHPADDYLERVKAEILVEAERARARAPLPRKDPPARQPAPPPGAPSGIEPDRLAYGIAELTGEHHVAFVEQAFRALLKRPSDEAGRNMQLQLLGRGASKAEVLGNLRWSAEGRHIGARVTGLLPRYVWSKLARVPVLGYCIDWALALAGLPRLLRHQRAADAMMAARSAEHRHASQALEERMAGLDQAVQALLARAVPQDLQPALLALEQRLADLEKTVPDLQIRKSEQDLYTQESVRALHADIRALAVRIGHGEQHVADAQARGATLEQAAQQLRDDLDSLRDKATERERDLGELRHYVQAGNHWMASVQGSFGDLERIAQDNRERAEALAARVAQSAAQQAARAQRHAGWAREVAQRLPAQARVLDLGSGDGCWLLALTALDIQASGVEAVAPLAREAIARRAPVGLGEPLLALERCSDESLGAVTLAAASIDAAPSQVLRLFESLQRVLVAGGWLFVRIEPEPWRFAATPTLGAERWQELLRAAQFHDVTTLVAGKTCLLVARRGA